MCETDTCSCHDIDGGHINSVKSQVDPMEILTEHWGFHGDRSGDCIDSKPGVFSKPGKPKLRRDHGGVQWFFGETVAIFWSIPPSLVAMCGGIPKNLPTPAPLPLVRYLNARFSVDEAFSRTKGLLPVCPKSGIWNPQDLKIFYAIAMLDWKLDKSQSLTVPGFKISWPPNLASVCFSGLVTRISGKYWGSQKTSAFHGRVTHLQRHCATVAAKCSCSKRIVACEKEIGKWDGMACQPKSSASNDIWTKNSTDMIYIYMYSIYIVYIYIHTYYI